MNGMSAIDDADRWIVESALRQRDHRGKSFDGRLAASEGH